MPGQIHVWPTSLEKRGRRSAGRGEIENQKEIEEIEAGGARVVEIPFRILFCAKPIFKLWENMGHSNFTHEETLKRTPNTRTASDPSPPPVLCTKTKGGQHQNSQSLHAIAQLGRPRRRPTEACQRPDARRQQALGSSLPFQPCLCLSLHEPLPLALALSPQAEHSPPRVDNEPPAECTGVP